MKIFKDAILTDYYRENLKPFLKNQSTLVAYLATIKNPREVEYLILIELESDKPRESLLNRMNSRLATLEKQIRAGLFKQCLQEKQKHK